ncbi:hypothetical protein OPAG_03161 [Rhodococcus opacus PD630]|nr:hypothetical protein OPAG_03161 [Rhodococcus opacus PD630]
MGGELTAHRHTLSGHAGLASFGKRVANFAGKRLSHFCDTTVTTCPQGPVQERLDGEQLERSVHSSQSRRLRNGGPHRHRGTCSLQAYSEGETIAGAGALNTGKQACSST